jgi:acyl-CoA reductase-like NAD-dependent aldehyde dehydrogenase
MSSELTPLNSKSQNVKKSLLYIGGNWTTSEDRKVFETYNPYDNSVVSSIQDSGKADIDAAVRSCKIANPQLQKASVETRAGWCELIAKAIESNATLLGIYMVKIFMLLTQKRESSPGE